MPAKLRPRDKHVLCIRRLEFHFSNMLGMCVDMHFLDDRRRDVEKLNAKLHGRTLHVINVDGRGLFTRQHSGWRIEPIAWPVRYATISATRLQCAGVRP